LKDFVDSPVIRNNHLLYSAFAYRLGDNPPGSHDIMLYLKIAILMEKIIK
jgi:hypothetical protein